MGGGVGIFIKNGISFKQIPMPELYTENFFENITLELTSKNYRCTMSSIYRSPSQIRNITQADQYNQFFVKLDELLSTLNDYDVPSFIFLDANIDLSTLNSNTQANEYADIIVGNGFIQNITRSTRIQGKSYSLIDHILTNDISASHETGIIISDVSDHFFTFIDINKKTNKVETKPVKRRSFTEQNINMFKSYLRDLSWADVTNENNVDASFNNFWRDFNMLFELCFPLCTFKFNKNIHKKKDFMTNGLITSRNQKNVLHKLALKQPTLSNINRYKSYRNMYNSLVRAMKKLYYEDSLQKNAKNPKKKLGIFLKNYQLVKKVLKKLTNLQ